MTHPDRKHPPETTELSGMSLPQVERRTLSNGVKLVTIDNGSQPVTRITVVHPGGKTDIDAPHLYPLLTAAISEGASSQTAAEIAETLEYNGAWTNFTAGRHNCVSTLYGLNSRAHETIPVFARIIAAPTLADQAIEAQCKKIAASTELARKKVSAQAAELWLETAFGHTHPAAHIITGDDFAGVSRDQVVSLHKKAFLGTPPTIYIAGQITDDIVKIIEDNFGTIAFDAANGIATRIVAPPHCQADNLQFRHVADSMQTAIKAGIPTLRRDNPEYEHMRLATIALGGYFGSRLMANIREDKGYTYGISASPAPQHEGTFITIECQTANEHARSVLNEIRNEIDRLAETDMPQQELTGIRRLMLSSMASVLDSPFSILDYIMSLDTFGLPATTFETQLQTVTEITPADIRQAAATYLAGVPQITACAGATDPH